MKNRLLPQIHTEIPGPQSIRMIGELQRYESPAITARRYKRSSLEGF